MNHLKTIAIVGTNSKTRDLAPWDDPNVDILTFNEAASDPAGWVKRWTAMLEMHPADVFTNERNIINPDYWKWLQQDHDGRIIWLQQANPLIPGSKAYPLYQVSEEYMQNISREGERVWGYFTSSVAYALALAGWFGYQRVELYGIEAETRTEYEYQRDGIFFWMGMLAAQGVEIYIPEQCSFFDRPLYAYTQEDVICRDEFEKTAQALEKEVRAAKSRQDKAIRRVSRPNARIADLTAYQTTLKDYGHVFGRQTENRNFAAHNQDIGRTLLELRINGLRDAIARVKTALAKAQGMVDLCVATPEIKKKAPALLGKYNTELYNLACFEGALKEAQGYMDRLDKFKVRR